jgi:hypothetical protein
MNPAKRKQKVRTPEEAIAEWHTQFNTDAIRDGWEIFSTGRDPDDKSVTEQIVNGEPYGYRPFELQAIEESDIFNSDAEAQVHVVRKALCQNTKMELATLKFLATYSPPEFEAVMRSYAEKVCGDFAEACALVGAALHSVTHIEELRKYSRHKEDCSAHEECTCGLVELWQSYDRQPKV